jgi:hypothetical protein
MGTCEIPNSSLYGLELLDLGLLGGDYVPRELIYLFVLSVPQRNARHSDCSLVVGDHRVDKAPIWILAVLHDHLPGHVLGSHAHRAVAHLAVVHLAVTTTLVTLLTTPYTPAGSQDEGYR